jgi:uncharacterized MnhB-related membrane protein
MTALLAVLFVTVAAAATGVALSRDLVKQVIMLSLLGLLLAVLFVVYQAPDVALSEIAVGSMILPLIIVLAIAKTRGRRG